MTEETFEIEVAYALPDEQVLLKAQVEQGATVLTGIEQSGILKKFPQIDPHKDAVGIFGKKSKLDALLSAGDRIEIYRPLIADPKEARKKRAAKGRPMKKGAAAAGEPAPAGSG